MDVDCTPAQPEAVLEAVAEVLAAEERPPVDPWWQAGIDETLQA